MTQRNPKLVVQSIGWVTILVGCVGVLVATVPILQNALYRAREGFSSQPMPGRSALTTIVLGAVNLLIPLAPVLLVGVGVGLLMRKRWARFLWFFIASLGVMWSGVMLAYMYGWAHPAD